VLANLGISGRMMDFATARAHMVHSQIRTSGVTDPRIIAAFMKLPREEFAPAERRGIAYVDDDLLLRPVNGAYPARYLMEPMVLARLVELAEVGPGDKALDVGCASGYGAAVLAELAREVIAIDEDPELVETALARLAAQGIANVNVIKAPHAEGFPDEAPFDVILIEGRVPAVPQALLGQLAEGGRLVAMIGDRPVASATLYMRAGNAISARSAFEAASRPLPGFATGRPAFVF
jgi:protein-L-isoaspartate(D-aspartate) O-methyltransferase